MDIVALRNGAQLQETYGHYLIQPITDLEIWEALKVIRETKTPRVKIHFENFQVHLGDH